MFIAREKELNVLEDLYEDNKFEIVILTGRKRIGKSTLLSKFMKDKPGIFFNAVEGNETLNLELLSGAIAEFEGFENSLSFSSYLETLENLFKFSLNEHFVFVIDEYPYLATAYKPISSLLQMLIDKYKDRSKMMLILSGSSISFMEKEVVAYKAPLFGRKTAQLKLEPLSFKESLAYFNNTNNRDKVTFYAIYGGTPYYLSQIDPEASVKENVKRTFLNGSSFLSEEPRNLLKQEVSELSSYYSVLAAIAGGATKLSEIASKVKLNSSSCAKITKNLIGLGLVFKEHPYGEKTNKRTLYKLNDNIFKFWFRFIPSNLPLITRELPEKAFDRIEPFLNEYVGPIFEDIAKEYLWKLLARDKAPISFYSLGRWWGTDPKTKSQVEIDIVGEADKENALFAEVKWTGEKVGVKVLKDLIEKSRLFPHLIKHYYVFSKSGFTPEAIDLASEVPNVHLVTLEEMINVFEDSDFKNGSDDKID